MLVFFLLSDLPILLSLLPSWSAMILVFLSPQWVVRVLLVLFAFPIFLLLPIWFIIFFLFANSQLTIPVLSNLTLLVLV